MKKILFTAVIWLFIITAVMACGAPHNPDGTFGKSIKGTFHDQPGRADYSTFGILVAMPRYREDAEYPDITNGPRAFNRTGDAELNTFDLNPNSYDPDLSRMVEQHVETIPGVNDAKVFVFAYHTFVGVDTNGQKDRLQQQIYRSVQNQVAGKDVRISFDADMFRRLGDVEQQLQIN
jgi:opacity protein-like surface antigen